jgi:hypothetical protein
LIAIVQRSGRTDGFGIEGNRDGVMPARASRSRPRATLLFSRQQIGVAREPPAPVALLAQDRERVAGAAHRLAAVRRRRRHLDVIAKIGPVAREPRFPGCRCFPRWEIFHAFGGRCRPILLLRHRLGGHGVKADHCNCQVSLCVRRRVPDYLSAATGVLQNGADLRHRSAALSRQSTLCRNGKDGCRASAVAGQCRAG